MRSFAVWYKCKNENDNDIKVKADVHVNLIESFKGNKWYIDFGIKVHDIDLVDSVYIYCPFELGSNKEIYDLTGVMNTVLLKALFNENLLVVEGLPKRKLIIFSKDGDIIGDKIISNRNVISKECFILFLQKYLNNRLSFFVYEIDLQNEVNLKYIKDNDSRGTIITINTKNIQQSVDDEIIVSNYYFRFRVAIPSSGTNIINHEIEGLSIANCKLTKTEIIDFRLNNTRSIGENAQDEINKGSFFKLDSVHLLILKNAKDVLMYPSDNPSTRMLEAELWHDYLQIGEQINNDMNDLVAYHFKKKLVNGNQEPITEFNILARFSSTTITKVAIFIFVLVAIALNILGCIVYDLINCIFGVYTI